MSDAVYIRVSEAPKLYGLSRSKIYRLSADGELRIRKVGGASLLKVSELESLIEGSQAGAVQQVTPGG